MNYEELNGHMQKMGMNMPDTGDRSERKAKLIVAIKEHPVGHILATESDRLMMADLIYNVMDEVVLKIMTRCGEMEDMAERPGAGLLMTQFVLDGLGHSLDQMSVGVTETMASAAMIAVYAITDGEEDAMRELMDSVAERAIKQNPNNPQYAKEITETLAQAKAADKANREARAKAN